MIHLWAGADRDGAVKVFRATADGNVRAMNTLDKTDNNTWLAVLRELGCKPGEMPRVELRRDPD